MEDLHVMSFELLDIAIRVSLVIATAILFAIVFLAYMRLKNRKLLFISTGFGIFFFHAIIYLPEVFGPSYEINQNAHLLIHMVGLIFILIGTLKD